MLTAGDDKSAEDLVSGKKVKVESGYFKKDDKAVLQKVPWEKGLYSVENNGMYYLAWLKDILPPGPMSFEEARPAIISDYQAFLEKMWLEQLRKRYTVKVNEKGKQYILQQLRVKIVEMKAFAGLLRLFLSFWSYSSCQVVILSK